MKVAISFYGQPRFYKQTFPQWSRYIEELGADVYMHTWWGEDMVGDLYPCAPHAKPGLYDKDMLVHENIIEELTQLYQPKRIEYDSYKTFELPKWTSDDLKKQYTAFQFYTQYRSKELVKESGNDYDIVIRTRIDLHIGVPISIRVEPNVIITSSTTPYANEPNDFLSISDLKTFYKISDVYLNLEEFFNSNIGHKMETYLFKQMIKESILNKTFTANWDTFDILRSTTVKRINNSSEKLFLE